MSKAGFYGVNIPSGLDKNSIKLKLEEWVESKGFYLGEVSYIFLSSSEMKDLNKEVLQHDYPTDVITFDETVERKIYAEIYVCPEVIEDNAKEYSVSLKSELIRVLVHGLLHCMGYDDGNEEEKKEMRKREDEALEFLNVSRGTQE